MSRQMQNPGAPQPSGGQPMAPGMARAVGNVAQQMPQQRPMPPQGMAPPQQAAMSQFNQAQSALQGQPAGMPPQGVAPPTQPMQQRAAPSRVNQQMQQQMARAQALRRR